MQADNFQRIEETLLSTRILIADHYPLATLLLSRNKDKFARSCLP